MAQPLAKPDLGPVSSLDAAASRVEEAFLRLEVAVKRAREGQHSLKADHEKLNLLLRKAEEETARLRQVAGAVSERIDRTIATLEKTE